MISKERPICIMDYESYHENPRIATSYLEREKDPMRGFGNETLADLDYFRLDEDIESMRNGLEACSAKFTKRLPVPDDAKPDLCDLDGERTYWMKCMEPAVYYLSCNGAYNINGAFCEFHKPRVRSL